MGQLQTAAAGAVAVQIHRDGNTVRIGRAGAELALRRLHGHRAAPTNIGELLRTDIRATGLVGRAAELTFAPSEELAQSAGLIDFEGD